MIVVKNGTTYILSIRMTRYRKRSLLLPVTLRWLVKVGDLVRMKYFTFWQKRQGLRHNVGGIPYTEQPLLIYEIANNAIKVILPSGQIKADLKEYYEVVSEAPKP